MRANETTLKVFGGTLGSLPEGCQTQMCREEFLECGDKIKFFQEEFDSIISFLQKQLKDQYRYTVDNQCPMGADEEEN